MLVITPETELYVILFTQREDEWIIFPNSRRLINTNIFPYNFIVII